MRTVKFVQSFVDLEPDANVFGKRGKAGNIISKKTIFRRKNSNQVDCKVHSIVFYSTFFHSQSREISYPYVILDESFQYNSTAWVAISCLSIEEVHPRGGKFTFRSNENVVPDENFPKLENSGNHMPSCLLLAFLAAVEIVFKCM